MMPARPPLPVLHGLSPNQVECLVLHAADAVLVLDADRRVAEVRALGPMQDAICSHWQGQPLAAIVCEASHSKLQSIFDSNACAKPEAARWRHINLNRHRDEPLPVLVKHLVLETGTVLLLRDLRPTMALQNRFQRAMMELEQSYQRLGWAGSVAENADGDEGQVAQSVVEDMLSGVGKRPMQQIVSETMQVLERLCIRQALRQSPDDTDAAARLLGLTRADLDRLSRSN